MLRNAAGSIRAMWPDGRARLVQMNRVKGIELYRQKLGGFARRDARTNKGQRSRHSVNYVPAGLGAAAAGAASWAEIDAANIAPRSEETFASGIFFSD